MSAVRMVDLYTGGDIVALDDLLVVPDERDQGIGAVLMSAMADHCPARPIRWEVEEGNLRAQRFSLARGAHLRRKVITRREPAPGAVAAGR